MTGNKQFLEELYAGQIKNSTQRMYLLTEGHWWIDRVTCPATELQRARLGGIAEWRGTIYPGHVVSWRFHAPAKAEEVAILVPRAKLDEFTVLAYNMKREPAKASMIGWDVTPGEWEMVIGRDTNGDDQPDGSVETRRVSFERTGALDLTFAPGVTTVVQMRLVSKAAPYWERPDLGIGPGDVHVSGGDVTITVHNTGSVILRRPR
jgi:hypothetical protein